MGTSENYPDRFAEAMALELTEIEKETVLELARTVAHGSERMFAPLSTYLAGQFVAELVRTGLPRVEALAEAVALAERTLGQSNTSERTLGQGNTAGPQLDAEP